MCCTLHSRHRSILHSGMQKRNHHDHHLRLRQGGLAGCGVLWWSGYNIGIIRYILNSSDQQSNIREEQSHFPIVTMTFILERDYLDLSLCTLDPAGPVCLRVQYWAPETGRIDLFQGNGGKPA